MLIFIKPAVSQYDFVRLDLVGPITTFKFGLGYEKMLAFDRTIIINGDFGKYMSDSQTGIDGQPFWTKSLTGWSIFPEYRIYPYANSYNRRPQGLFYGIYARYMNLFYKQNFDIKYEMQGMNDVTQNARLYGLGATLGFKYRKMDNHLYGEALLGLGWGYSTLTAFKYENVPNESLLWRYELSIGYTF